MVGTVNCHPGRRRPWAITKQLTVISRQKWNISELWPETCRIPTCAPQFIFSTPLFRKFTVECGIWNKNYNYLNAGYCRIFTTPVPEHELCSVPAAVVIWKLAVPRLSHTSICHFSPEKWGGSTVQVHKLVYYFQCARNVFLLCMGE